MADGKRTDNMITKQMIVFSLCRQFSLDPNLFLWSVEENDIKTLYSNILKASSLDDNEEVAKWIAFAEEFPANSEASAVALQKLNDDLVTKSVLLGNGFKPSAADVVVFSAVYSSVIGLSKDTIRLPHLIRWMDHIQSNADFGQSFKKILVEKPAFVPHVGNLNLKFSQLAIKVEEDNLKKNVESTKAVDKPEAEPNVKKSEPNAKKSESVKKPKAITETNQEKKKLPEAEASGKDELSVSLLNIRVGLIRKAWKHASADSLLVEEIDVGEAKARQVVSGLAKYCSPDSLTNRRVVLITNVKPGKLRDVMSEGLVLCASSEDHSVVEPLLPPEGAQIGEQISFSGIDGKPEDVLNPKKKQLEKITPNLYTDEKGVATFKGIPFMTSAGPCNSSILKASIK